MDILRKTAKKWGLSLLAMALMLSGRSFVSAQSPVTNSATVTSVTSPWEGTGASKAQSTGQTQTTRPSTRIRSMELILSELENDDNVKPVAAQEKAGDLWEPEEAAPSVLPPGSNILAPESIIPKNTGREGSQQIELPDKSVIDLNPDAQKANEIKPNVAPASPLAAPATAPSALQEKGPSTASGSKLKNGLEKSTIQIDRSGNVAPLQVPGSTRTKDGTLLGNPYANGVYEYHPRCFQVNPNAQVYNRTSLPVESWGEDGYGNSALLSCGGCGHCSACCPGSNFGWNEGIEAGGYQSSCGTASCGTGGYLTSYGAAACGATACETACDPCYTGCGEYDGGDCGGYGCGGYGCGGYGCGGCGVLSCCCPKLRWALQNTEAEVGVFGFKDPFGVGNENNFGVDLALNWSTPSRFLFGLAGQAGGRFTQTGKEEYFVGGIDESSRTQFFWTSGLFYRNPNADWQFGAVYDSLRDDSAWAYTIGQARVELSRRFTSQSDFGFRGAFRVNDTILNLVNFGPKNDYEIRVNSYYTAFLRHHFDYGGEGMIYGGMTEDSEGLVGGHLEVPICDYACLRNSFVYVFPKDTDYKYEDNSWSVNLSLVFYLGGNSRSGMENPLRPLFEVADNTTFLQKVK